MTEMKSAGRHTLKLNLSEETMFALQQEASIDNITMAELVKRGVALAIVVRSTQREIASHFPVDTELHSVITVVASNEDSTVRKGFSVTPSFEDPVAFNVMFLKDL